MSRILSKSKIIAGLICPKQLYLKVHHPELAKVSGGSQARMQAGNDVGELARALYPEGILIEHGDDPSQALRDTREVLEREGDLTMFEPAFSVGGVFFRADILQRIDGHWHLAEVKSSTSVKEYHRWDVATQYWAMDQLGTPPERVELAHIDNRFVYPGEGDYRGLFNFEDIRDQVLPLVEEVPVWIESFQAMLAGSSPPVAVGAQCNDPYECPFIDYCDPPEQRAIYPVSLLPNGGETVKGLISDGFHDLREIPPSRLSNPKHLRVHQATLSGLPYVSADAANDLKQLGWPRYFLDFETIQFAVPIWPGTRPYQQLPFQWSCHVAHADGRIEHREFLDLSGDAPMRAFAESLIEAIPDDGGVIIGYYVSFEMTVIKALAERFPDLHAPLIRLVDRCWDLCAFARNHYYHPAMKGSWSLKAVLPTVAPELDYAKLDVQHGGMAQEAYLEAIHPDTTSERKEALRQGLLIYCGRDTEALIRLMAFFEHGSTQADAGKEHGIADHNSQAVS